MRIWGILLGMTIGIPGAHAACGDGAVVRDWGLYRAWYVRRDCTHPERPAVLAEMPWTVHAARAEGEPASNTTRVPAVRAGTRVRIAQRGETAEVQLVGMALNTAGVGERVMVRIGLSGAVLNGIVRARGLVELDRGRADLRW